MTRFLPLLLLLTLAVPTPDARGDDPASAPRLISVGGEVVVGSGDDAHPAIRGNRLREGDVLRTGANSRVQLRLGDGAVIFLGEHSELRLDRLPAGSGDESRLYLSKGIVRGVEARQAVRLSTPLGRVVIPSAGSESPSREGAIFDCYLASALYCGVYAGALSVHNPRGRLQLGQGERHDYAVLARQTAPKGLLYRPDALLDLSRYPPGDFLGETVPSGDPGDAGLSDSAGDNGARLPAPAPIRVEPKRKSTGE